MNDALMRLTNLFQVAVGNCLYQTAPSELRYISCWTKQWTWWGFILLETNQGFRVLKVQQHILHQVVVVVSFNLRPRMWSHHSTVVSLFYLCNHYLTLWCGLAGHCEKQNVIIMSCQCNNAQKKKKVEVVLDFHWCSLGMSVNTLVPVQMNTLSFVN